MERENWINKILETTAKIKEVEVSPFLYQKIVTRLTRAEEESISLANFKLGWSIALVSVVILNISALTFYMVRSNHLKDYAAIEKLSGELSLNTTYLY
jgi:hypothetical protein